MVEKLKLNMWKPDYGPVKIHKTAGVTAIGARQFLIAYNINLNTMDKTIASDIALDIREAGRAKRDKSNKIFSILPLCLGKMHFLDSRAAREKFFDFSIFL